MAHRGVCPEMACQRLEQEKKRQQTKKSAYQAVGDELGIPWKTIQTWELRASVEARQRIRNKQKSKFELLENRFKSIRRLLATMADFRMEHPEVFTIDHELEKELPDGHYLTKKERPDCFEGEQESLWNCWFLFYSFAGDLADYLDNRIDKVYTDYKRQEK